jgi:hypothetical protein
METWTAEILLISETGAWTAEQSKAAREAVREYLKAFEWLPVDESQIDSCLKNGLMFAKNYQRPAYSAAWQHTYYIGVEAEPEFFEKIAANMRRVCSGVGLTVRIDEYR